MSVPVVFRPEADGSVEGDRRSVRADCDLDAMELPAPDGCPVCSAQMERMRLDWAAQGHLFTLVVSCPGYRCPSPACGIELLTADVHASLLRNGAARTAHDFGEDELAAEFEEAARALEIPVSQ